MSQDDKVINVREVLQQNSYTTTVDELRNRGKSRVRVINAEQISALIEEAVNRVISTSGGMGRDEVKKIVEKSREEFRRLLAEREKELSEHRDRLRQLDQAREDLAKVTSESERLRIVEAELRRQNETMSAQVADLKLAARGGENSEAFKAEIDKFKKNEETIRRERDAAVAQANELRRVEAELRKNEEAVRKEKDAAVAQMNEARRAELEIRKNAEMSKKESEGFSGKLASLELAQTELRKSEAAAAKEKEALLAQIAELNKTIHELASKKPEPAPVVNQSSPEVMEILRTLGSELASVKAGLKEAAAKPAEDKGSADKMSELQKELASRLDQIGRKVGIAPVEVPDAVGLDNLFADQESLKSNIEDVEVKERRGSGIGGALEKIKALRNKKGGDSKDKEPKK